MCPVSGAGAASKWRLFITFAFKKKVCHMTLPFPMLLKSTIKPSHNILDDHICNNILKLTNPHLSDWKECWSKYSVQPANSVQPAKNILCHTCRCIGIVAVWADDKVCHWWPKKPWHGLLLTLGVAREILAHCCRSVYYASLLSSPESMLKGVGLRMNCLL